MADFLPIVKKTFSFEGGFQQFPNDTANYNSRNELIGTNHGISAKALETYTGKIPTVNDVKAITIDLAQTIYKKNYWNPLRGDSIKNQDVAHIMFDSFIASGYAGLKRVRAALNKVYGHDVVKVVGAPFAVSDVTLINGANPKTLFDTIKQGEIDNRKYLAQSNPAKYGQFLKGWLSRLDQITFSGVAKTGGTVILITGLFFLGRFLYKQQKQK